MKRKDIYTNMYIPGIYIEREMGGGAETVDSAHQRSVWTSVLGAPSLSRIDVP